MNPAAFLDSVIAPSWLAAGGISTRCTGVGTATPTPFSHPEVTPALRLRSSVIACSDIQRGIDCERSVPHVRYSFRDPWG